MDENKKQSAESAIDNPECNQKENDKRPKKRSEVQTAVNSAPVDESKMSEEELLEFYKTKCTLMQNELDKYRESCSRLETNNFDLTTKIDELREIVAKSNEMKEGLEEMGIDVDKYLDLIEDE